MKKKISILENLDAVIAGAVFVFMLAFTISAVFMRYIVGQPYLITEEVQLWCMVWLVFFGIIVVSRRGSQIAIDIIIDSLPKTIGKIVETMILILTLALMAYVLYQGILYVDHMIEHNRRLTMMQVSYGIIYASAPISFALMFIYTVRDIIKLWKKTDADKEVE